VRRVSSYFWNFLGSFSGFFSRKFGLMSSGHLEVDVTIPSLFFWKDGSVVGVVKFANPAHAELVHSKIPHVSILLPKGVAPVNSIELLRNKKQEGIEVVLETPLSWKVEITREEKRRKKVFKKRGKRKPAKKTPASQTSAKPAPPTKPPAKPSSQTQTPKQNATSTNPGRGGLQRGRGRGRK
jgi:hypothetical protein